MIHYKIQSTIWKIVLLVHVMNLKLITMFMTIMKKRICFSKSWVWCLYNFANQGVWLKLLECGPSLECFGKA